MKTTGSPRTILLTGASRGLGLEFTRQWLVAGHRVFALARDPEASRGLSDLSTRHAQALVTCPCDVTDDASLEAARRRIEKLTDRLDLVLNNAGTYGSEAGGLSALDLAEVRRVFEVNTLGPLRVSRSFLPLLRRGSRAKLVHITSLMGSIADNRSGSALAYRMSKAALNMASRNLALELASDGILSVVLHPGWVQTDMGGPRAPLPVGDAVASLIKTIDRLTLEQSGAFFDREGRPAPW